MHSFRTLTLLFALLLPAVSPAVDLGSLTNADAAAGLKKALDQGIEKAVGELGVTDGFLKNPKVKIDLPPKLAKAQNALRLMGLGQQTDDLVVAMNRAAEAAVPESKELLKQALKSMSVADAKAILTGGADSATQFFKGKTFTPLKAKFAPIIGRATQKVKLTERYDAIAGKGAELGLIKPEDASVQSYVTERTLDGLFVMMAEEEQAIRKDPLGQASSLLKKVFGAVSH